MYYNCLYKINAYFDRRSYIMNGIVLLSDSILLNAYHQAIQLKLDREFIELLMAEINRRNIHVQT